MADVVGNVLAINFVQGPDYLQDVAVSKAEAENAAARAKTSELNALGSANKAKQSENIAVASAEAAKVSEEHAKTSEERAAAYATTAFGASAPAWSDTATYNYPAVVAYTDGNTYRCIGTDVTGTDIPGDSDKWFKLTLDLDDFWEIDMWGGYMPTEMPMYSSSWTLDVNGDLEPIAAN